MKAVARIGAFLEKYDRLAFSGVFLLALGLRLAALTAGPLSPREAAEAWGAFHLVQGGTATGVSPLYDSFTAVLFTLGGPADWLARLLPALAGAGLVFLPRLLLGTRAKAEALVAAGLLALSPTIGMASVEAGGAALGLLATGLWMFHLRTARPNPLANGLLLGAAFASGPVGWSGMILAFGYLLIDRIRRNRSAAARSEPANPFSLGLRAVFPAPAAWLGVAIGLGAGSTACFLFPKGFGALAAGFSNWIQAFLSGPPPVGEVFLTLVAYEPLALIFGFAAIIPAALRRKMPEEERFLIYLVAAAAVWTLVRPSGFPAETLWLTLPLVLLATGTLRWAYAAWESEDHPGTLAGQIGIAGLLTVFAGITLSMFVASHDAWKILLTVTALVMSAFAGPLFTEKPEAAWTRTLAALAAVWLVTLTVAEGSAGWNAVNGRRTEANELWWTDTTIAEAGSLLAAMNDVSIRQTGQSGDLAAVVELPADSALAWELMAYRNIRYEQAPGGTPPMIVTYFVEQNGTAAAPQLAAAYAGRPFVIETQRGWSGWPPDVLAWLLYRASPTYRINAILWVREDLLAPPTVLR